MSLTINPQVTGIDPVYNPMYFQLTSNDYSYINFKYVFNLYSGTSSTGNLLSTIALNPRPDGSCQYNPARILESVVGPDNGIATISAITQSNSQFEPYSISFNEQYTGVRFNATQNGGGGYVQFNTVGDNPFISGDSVTVVQDAGYTYSGQNGTGMVTYSNGSSVTVNLPYGGRGTTNQGTISYSDGRTITSSASTYSAYTFNGVLQYTQYPSWNPATYTMSETTTSYSGKFLTDQPRTPGTLVRNLTDYGTLSFMMNGTNFSSGGKSIEVVYRITDIYGNLVQKTQTFSTPITNIVHIPAGPANINLMFSGNPINTNTSNYTISLYENNPPLFHSSYISEYVRYNFDTNCSKYQTVRLQFMNPYGAWDYINFNMISREFVNLTNRGQYKAQLPMNYSVGFRERTQLDISGNYTYLVNSEWLDNTQAIWMQELLTSPYVNIINSDGSYWPVNIQEMSIEIHKQINDKMFMYSFNLDTAYDINSQRP